jgi:hypothetical protein
MTRMPLLALLCLPALAWGSEPPTTIALVDARPLTQVSDWGELAWSPDSRQLSVHNQGGVWIVDPDGAPLLSGALDLGAPPFRHRFPGSPEPVADAPAVWAQRDDIWLREGGAERRLTQGEDRFYDPVLSPDGRRVAFSGLVTGLHVLDLQTGRLAHLGSGRWPGWHPDGWLVFERNADDGHHLTEADLWLWHPRLATPLGLTSSPETIDRFPAFSPDGSQLAWVRDGAIWVAGVREVGP